MCQGGQGNFMQEGQTGPMTNVRPGFGGSASWGGDYGNWANKNVPPGGNFGNWGGNPNASGLVWGTSGPSPYPGWGGLVPEGNPWGQWSPPVQNPGMPPAGKSPIGSTETSLPANPFAGIDAGRLAQAQRFANAGMFGRAQQQIGLGGGNWDDVGGLLRQDAKENPYVKGSSMGFDWGDATAGRLAKAKELAAAGKMGQAKQMYERGGGKWSPGMHSQFKAWQKANT